MWSVGHGTLTASAFAELLHGAGIRTIADVRRFPGSRRHPQFGKDELDRWLPAAGIGYRWMPGLGGRRSGSPDSPNVALRNVQFRAYADHMSSTEFAGAVDDLLDLALDAPVAVMCAESVWWRCHRRLLADHLVLVAGVSVEHVHHDGRLTQHPVTLGARRVAEHVIYDAGSSH
jgi:uncharacterized protein (DUF488 family)